MSGDIALKAVDDYLSVLSQYRHGDDGPVDPARLAGGPAAERLGQAMKGQSPEVRASVAARLAAGVAALPDPLPAAIVAYHLGSMVEDGRDPVPLADALRTPAAGRLRRGQALRAVARGRNGHRPPRPGRQGHPGENRSPGTDRRIRVGGPAVQHARRDGGVVSAPALATGRQGCTRPGR